MPSPFPGMDPFIESQAWVDFHGALIAAMRGLLVSQVRPNYIVRSEERVYVDHSPEPSHDHIWPDLVVSRESISKCSGSRSAVLAMPIESVEVSLPMPEDVTERYLTIVSRETLEVITIIELLSPANKRAASDGRTEYLTKREQILTSMTNLVEIDLLRRGQRLPTNQPLPPADFYTLVSRGNRRPRATAYYWTIRQALPTIHIPLKHSDPDVPLDLQAAFNAAYDSGGYDYSLDYSAPIEPPLSEEDAAWAQDILRSHGTV